MLRRSIIVIIILLLLGAPIGYQGIQRAEAQFGQPLDFLRNLFGAATGGQTVRIVDDMSPNTILNTLKTDLIQVATGLIQGNINSLNLKETVWDPIAWNMAKHLIQQLQGDLIKWLNGQLPGQDGQAQFVQSYDQHLQGVVDQAVGQYFEDVAKSTTAAATAGVCDETQSFNVRAAIMRSYQEDKRRATEGGPLMCPDPNSGDTARPYSSLAHKIFGDFTECREEICALNKGRIEMYSRALQAERNELRILEQTGGMLPQRVCAPIDPSNPSSAVECPIVNPLYLAKETVSFQLAQLPGLQLLQVDEWNEMISQFVSGLANQALTGLNGVLGLTQVFDGSGGLSYVDQMLADSSWYPNLPNNPIRMSLDSETKRREVSTEVVTQVAELENTLATNREDLGSCFDLSIDDTAQYAVEVRNAKQNASTTIDNTDRTIPVLQELSDRYDATTDSVAKNAIMSEYMGVQSLLSQSGYQMDSFQNQQSQAVEIDLNFKLALNEFRSQVNQERCSCGRSVAYTDLLGQPASCTTTDGS